MSNGNLVLVDCAKCGVEFDITHVYWSRRKKDGQAFNCPNGHGNVYSKDESDDDDDSGGEGDEEKVDDGTPLLPPAKGLGKFEYEPVKIL